MAKQNKKQTNSRQFIFPEKRERPEILSGTAGRSGVKEEGRKKKPEIQATWFADLRNLNVT